MSQLILQINNQQDLKLLLLLVERLDIKVVRVNEIEAAQNDKITLMQQAASDPLFLADIATITEDFKYVDGEQI